MQHVSVIVNEEPSDRISTAKNLLQISTCKVLWMTQLLMHCVVAIFPILYIIIDVAWSPRYCEPTITLGNFRFLVSAWVGNTVLESVWCSAL